MTGRGGGGYGLNRENRADGYSVLEACRLAGRDFLGCDIGD